MQINDFGPCDLSVDEIVNRFEVSPQLRACLDDLESRIDPEVEDALLADYMTFLDGGWHESLFSPRRTRVSASGITWPTVTINEALVDFNSMALQQVSGCNNLLASGGGAPLSIRSNYGICISSSWYGCELRMMAPEFDTLPTNMPLSGTEPIDVLIATGIPDVLCGYSARV